MENRIRQLRETLGLTQDELAGQLDVSRQTIISLEKGKYNPSLILAFKLAGLFQHKIEEIFIFNQENE